MILIGQYDSPFVRRVGIALKLYGLEFEHRPWSVFRNSDLIAPLNPLTRVPTLVLADGEVLVDSVSIIDYLDNIAPAADSLFPRVEPQRRRALRIAALGLGLAEKAVSLFYEKRLHQAVSEVWVNRCKLQIKSVLSALEAERLARQAPFWFGDTIGHADIAVAVALRFQADAHPGLAPLASYPALRDHSERCEALAVFKEISQPFIPPA